MAVGSPGIIARDLVAEEFGVGEPCVLSGLGNDDRWFDRAELRQLARWLNNDRSFTQATSAA